MIKIDTEKGVCPILAKQIWHGWKSKSHNRLVLFLDYICKENIVR